MRVEDWIPIEQLEDKYEDGLLIAAPELVHGDWNVRGVSRGYWSDCEGPNEEGAWIGTGWDGCNDEPTRVVCSPTHFMRIVTPYSPADLEIYAQANYGEDMKCG